MVNKQKILIVDDDENIAELISLYLTKNVSKRQWYTMARMHSLHSTPSGSHSAGLNASGH